MSGAPDGVLVTGATGFLGRAVLRRLGPAAEAFTGDLTDPGVLRRLSSRVAGRRWGVIHLAGGSPGAGPARVAACNVDTTLGLLEAAGTALSWVVHASSVAVYGISRQRRGPDGPSAAPDTAYGRAKWLAEEALTLFGRTSGARATHLRLASLYGPGNTGGSAVAKLTSAVAAGDPFVVDPAAPVRARDYLHVDDAARAVVAAATGSAEGVLDIGTGVASSPYDLVAALRSRGRQVRLEDPRGRPVTAPGPVSGAFACDVKRARAELDVPEPRTLADGLPDELAWRAGPP